MKREIKKSLRPKISNPRSDRFGFFPNADRPKTGTEERVIGHPGSRRGTSRRRLRCKYELFLPHKLCETAAFAIAAKALLSRCPGELWPNLFSYFARPKFRNTAEPVRLRFSRQTFTPPAAVCRASSRLPSPPPHCSSDRIDN